MMNQHALNLPTLASKPPASGRPSIDAPLPIDPPAWLAKWIGLPFELGGRGPDAFDCWGLARAVLATEFGLHVPSYDRGYPEDACDCATLAALVREGMPGWRAVVEGNAAELRGERSGDLILMRHGRHACHVGMVVARGTMLHIEDGTNSSLDRYDGPRWRRRLVGIYRNAKVA